MLTDTVISNVKATAPILDEHGEALTRHFYKRMFSHNPEVKEFFNQSNQHAGTQQRALAGAVCAYAHHIDNLGALKDAVELIAHKHCALQIQPEHYPIVGANLLASIKEVLGDGATDEIVSSWATAYGILADVLIGREKAIYDENAAVANGWRGFKKFRVVQKLPESDIITSFVFKPEDGAGVPVYKPGQYITVRVPTPCGSTTMRNYSLSDKPGAGHFRISVKREDGDGARAPGGYVSNKLHSEIKVGDVVELGSPCGCFFLPAEPTKRPLILAAGGVGITPILSMLLYALEKYPADQPITFIYACRNAKVQPFKKLLSDLASKHSNLNVIVRYSDEIPPESAPEDLIYMPTNGFIDAALLDTLKVGGKKLDLPSADYYFCGPKPFMINLNALLLESKVPSSQINFEFFGPLESLEKPKEAQCPFLAGAAKK